MAKLTASVVGGGMGGRLSLGALNRSDLFDLVAVADLRPEVCAELREQFPGIRTFESNRDMFRVCPTDIVCVSTYPPSHEEVTMDALKLPLKGILVEKPLGHTVASGRRIIEAIKAKGIPMATPHGLLAKKTPLEVLRRVHGGEIGRLELFEVQCDKWDIINAGIHWMNFFIRLTEHENLEYVMALCESSTRTYRDGMQVETTGVTYVQTQSAVRAVMNTGDHVKISRAGKDTLFRIVGTEGVIEFWGWENGYRIQNEAHPAGTLVIPEEYAVIGHQRHLESLANQIHTGQFDYTIPESSLLALEICEAAYLSSRYRAKVSFPVDEYQPQIEDNWNPGEPYSGTGGGRDGRNL